jgi:hypothetical protein
VADVKWLQVEAVLMTSEPIRAYGGIVIPQEALVALASSLDAARLPMHLDHDLSRPLRIRDSKVWVEEGKDGVHLLRMAYEIHPDDFDAVGARKGMSATIHSPIPGHEVPADAEAPLIDLAADNAWFDDEAILSAGETYRLAGVAGARVRTGRAYQFSAIPDPQIYITILPELVLGLSTGVLGNMIWDGLKRLFQRRRTPQGALSDTPTIMNIQVTDGQRSLTGVVQTNSDVVAQRAVSAFETLARRFVNTSSDMGHDSGLVDHHERQVLKWDQDSDGWVPPR